MPNLLQISHIFRARCSSHPSWRLLLPALLNDVHQSKVMICLSPPTLDINAPIHMPHLTNFPVSTAT